MSTRPIRVRAHSGGHAEEEPRAILVGGRWLEIEAVTARWRQPEGRVFRVRTADGARYQLLCREPELEWQLLET